MLRIKELRTEKGLTQKELGEKINSTSKNIWAYENEFATPPLDILIRLADFFECSLGYLAGREDDFGNVTVNANAGEQLTDSERHLLEVYRKLNNYGKMRLESYADVRLEEQIKTENRRA